MTDDRIRELLREMRDGPVPADSQARVRLAVAERAQSWPERLRGYWKVAAAGVVAPAGFLLVAMLMREPPRVGIARIPAPAEIPAPEPPPPPAAPVAHRVEKAVRRPVAERHGNVGSAATVIRIETADPDVVILLVGG